jgi:glc operon protein GlcG
MSVSNRFFQVLIISITLFAIIEKSAMSQPVVTPPAQASYGLSIDINPAKDIAAAAITTVEKNNWRMAIAIVDTGGHLVYFEKMQHTRIGSNNLAIEKARTAVLFQVSTKVFNDRLLAGGEGLRLLSIKEIVPIEGGIPIVVNGQVIGSIGVSGGTAEQDGIVAKAGVMR